MMSVKITPSKPSVAMLSVVFLRIVMLSVILLNVFNLSVILLSVVAPLLEASERMEEE
jgi:hypothetical protein